jgi:tight adherence protein C
MISVVATITFLATLVILTALLYAFLPGEVGIAARLSRMVKPPVKVEEQKFLDKQKERAVDSLATVGKLMPAAAQPAPRANLLLIRAGYRTPEAIMAMRGVKLLVPIGLFILVFTIGLYRWNPFFSLAGAAALGYLLPEIWLMLRVGSRQHRLRRALPDGLDLLVICVEAGLGLDQALMKVSQDLRITHKELSDELQLVNLEMRIGKSRLDALRELARRTGLEDIKSLVAMLIQTERFGTSVAQSLRVFSDELRTKRRQRAEERSAKTTVKIVPPLVFFIFPALLVVILGPAVITLMRTLFPMFQK